MFDGIWDSTIELYNLRTAEIVVSSLKRGIESELQTVDRYITRHKMKK